MASLRHLWSRRAVRILFVTAYAVGLGAYLSLGDLMTAYEDEGSLLFVVVSATGIAGLVVLAGWHALWLLPLATVGFAEVYVESFWTPPPGIPTGMDSLGWHPTDVVWLMPLAWPYTAILAAIWAYAKSGGPKPR